MSRFLSLKQAVIPRRSVRMTSIRCHSNAPNVTASGPTLKDFVKKKKTTFDAATYHPPPMPYSPPDQLPPATQKVFLETYGCQMNFNDSEIVLGILQKEGRFSQAKTLDDADVVLLMTCAIRENAESKIWNRLDSLRAYEKQKKRPLTVGVLGCMAERLKTDLLEKKRNVDLVCGPDAYRDLPRLLQKAEQESAVNVMLSLEETYADIAPVRLDPSKKSAFVSIMRGCNNMCAFCIVPFTRGRERSRPIESILAEVKMLSEQGIREVTLLGQNVNSYCDLSDGKSTDTNVNESESEAKDGGNDSAGPVCSTTGQPKMSRNFKTVYKLKTGGRRFAELLDKVSAVDPNMRIRFTSPHPKDFPDELLFLMRSRPNICKQIHMPAQSGSSTVLEQMRRGYTREAYLELVARIKEIIPEVSLSSDFITGFCGETEEDHKQTLSLMSSVRYDMAYMFAYSMRERTMAHRRYQDDVPQDVKQRRLQEVVELFYSSLSKRVRESIGKRELILVEGPSKRSSTDLAGRTDGNRTVVFPSCELPVEDGQVRKVPEPGDYVEVVIESVNGSTPVGKPIKVTSIPRFATS